MSKRWLQRISVNHLMWVKLAKSQGAKIPECRKSLEDANVRNLALLIMPSFVFVYLIIELYFSS